MTKKRNPLDLKASKPRGVPFVPPPQPLTPEQMAVLLTPTVADVDAKSAQQMAAEAAAVANKKRLYAKFFSHAAEADFALDRCAKLAKQQWSTVLEWIQDPEFVDGWARTRVELNERLFGTSVEMALGRRIGEDPETKAPILAPPDGAMVRHLQGALDDRFAKRTTVEHKGTVDVHVSAALGAMSDAEKRAELRRLLAEDEGVTLEMERASREPLSFKVIGED